MGRVFKFFGATLAEQGRKTGLVTITGLVIPAKWGPKGEVLAVAIAAFDEETYLVLPDARSQELMSMLHRKVTVVGRTRINDGGENMLKVMKVKSKRPSRHLLTMVAMAALLAGVFLVAGVGTVYADQAQGTTTAPAVKKPAADTAGQPAVKATKPPVKKAAVVKKAKKPALKADPKVVALQKALTKAGYKLKADGIIGKKTRLALRKYQKSKKLKVTGKPDPATLKALGLV